jgi:hypothetical protein
MFIQNQDFNALVAELVRYTTFMLQNYGGFLPLGASVSAGEVQISAPAADQQHSTGLAWLEDLREGLRRQTADAHCAAVAYCVDVKLTDTRNGEVSEAVQVVLEHRSGEALDAIFPYKKTADGYQFTQPMLRIGAPVLFAQTCRSSVN